MTARDVLLDLARCNFDGKGWYGGNLLTALRKTDYKLAGKRFGKLKTIYQQAHHAAYWKYAAMRRITRDKSMTFRYRGANWPATHAPKTPQDWDDLIQYLAELQAQFVELVKSLPEERFSETMVLKMLHGVASHDVYHNGQIRHLRAMAKVK